MTEEPRWPTVDDVADAAAKAGDPPRLASKTEVALAIKLCRDAWRALTDDPSKSPVGEVRSSPEGALYCRVAHRTDFPWVLVHGGPPPAGWHWFPDDVVKGWPVIGAVPGTPAAEAKP